MRLRLAVASGNRSSKFQPRQKKIRAEAQQQNHALTKPNGGFHDRFLSLGASDGKRL
jgi:hypothetical protein